MASWCAITSNTWCVTEKGVRICLGLAADKKKALFLTVRLFLPESQDTATFATTGGHVWPAAARLLEYLEAVADTSELSVPGVRVLELGAGTGWLAMALAKNLPHVKSVCATEMAAGGALRWLRRNIETNESGRTEELTRLWKPGVVTARECDWSLYLGGEETRSGYGDGEGGDGDGVTSTAAETNTEIRNKTPETRKSSPDTETLQSSPPETLHSSPETLHKTPDHEMLNKTPWDFIIGSDLVYDDNGTRMLPKVFRALLDCAAAAHLEKSKTNSGDTKQTPVRAFYAHTKYRYELRDIEFFSHMREAKLVMTEVREKNLQTPPSSPEALSQLFPEPRIAVFRITRAEDEERDG